MFFKLKNWEFFLIVHAKWVLQFSVNHLKILYARSRSYLKFLHQHSFFNSLANDKNDFHETCMYYHVLVMIKILVNIMACHSHVSFTFLFPHPSVNRLWYYVAKNSMLCIYWIPWNFAWIFKEKLTPYDC
jgi:hypothetical protein